MSITYSVFFATNINSVGDRSNDAINFPFLFFWARAVYPPRQKDLIFPSPPPLIPNPSKYPRGLVICHQPSHDLVSAFHEEPTDPDRGEREQWKSQVERSDGILEIASLGFVSSASKSRVSALILGTAHRNGIVCCWLASRSRSSCSSSSSSSSS